MIHFSDSPCFYLCCTFVRRLKHETVYHASALLSMFQLRQIRGILCRKPCIKCVSEACPCITHMKHEKTPKTGNIFSHNTSFTHRCWIFGVSCPSVADFRKLRSRRQVPPTIPLGFIVLQAVQYLPHPRRFRWKAARLLVRWMQVSRLNLQRNS